MVERKCPSLNLTYLVKCLKKFGLIFLSQLIWMINQKGNLNPNQLREIEFWFVSVVG